jgi:hypothetical protein
MPLDPNEGAMRKIPRHLAGCLVVVASWSLAQTAGAAGVLPSARPGNQAQYGKFTFTGPISGGLVPLAGTCDASTSAADVEFSWYGKVTTLKGVSAKSIVSLELDLAGSRYGISGRLKNTGGNPPFLTFGATSLTGEPQDWQSVSGSYSTAKKGASGTLDVTLDQADGQPGRIVVKGEWGQCKLGGNI